MNDDVILARKMARIALITRDAMMWAAAHNLIRGSLQCH